MTAGLIAEVMRSRDMLSTLAPVGLWHFGVRAQPEESSPELWCNS